MGISLLTLWSCISVTSYVHNICVGGKVMEKLLLLASPILNSGKVSQLLDPSLGDSYDLDEMERMVLAATRCIIRAPRARPQMSLVSD